MTPPDENHASRYAAIVLAAGQSRRFGTDNKLLASFEGIPMLSRVLDAVAAGGVGRSIVVTGEPDEKIDALLRGRTTERVWNQDYASGMGSSIACGIAQVGPTFEGAFIVLGDMPLIPVTIFDALGRLIGNGHTIARPVTTFGPGHPVLFSRRHFPQLAGLRGERGAGSVIAAAGTAVALLENAGPGCFRDFDTKDALDRYRG